jgi:hypothetical protein
MKKKKKRNSKTSEEKRKEKNSYLATLLYVPTRHRKQKTKIKSTTKKDREGTEATTAQSQL